MKDAVVKLRMLDIRYKPYTLSTAIHTDNQKSSALRDRDPDSIPVLSYMFYKFIYPNLPKPKHLTFLLKASQ